MCAGTKVLGAHVSNDIRTLKDFDVPKCPLIPEGLHNVDGRWINERY